MKTIEVPHAADTQFDVPILSRRKHSARPITDKDEVAWRLCIGLGRELVFRSPFDRNEWVTEPQLMRIRAMLSAFTVVFSSRKGNRVITKPLPRQRGWVSFAHIRGRRFERIFDPVLNEWRAACRGCPCECNICEETRVEAHECSGPAFVGAFGD